MNALQSTLYTAAFALCVFSAGILRGKRRASERVGDYFTLFLVVEGAAFGLELLMGHEDAPFKSLWLGLRMAMSLVIAPCLWLAVKEIVDGERPAWTAIERRQFWLMLLGALLTLPLIETAHGGVTYVNPERPVGMMHARVIHAGMLGCIAIFAWQVPHYLVRCRRLLTERTRESRAGGTDLSRLQLALAIVFVTWVVGLGRTLHCALIGHRPDFGPWFALAEVSVTVAAIYAIVCRGAESAKHEDGARAPEVKYERSALSPAVRERIKQKLERAMEEDRLYADSLLNLRSLSAALKEKAHYVSQVINQDFGVSFHEFVNGRRIEEAKRRLVEAPDRTVLDVALAVGFNAKSTFNTAFRRRTGMTPTEFRAGRKTA